MAYSVNSVLGTSGTQNPTGKDAFSKLDMSDFVKLMISELQNQDPMNPMSNSEMLQQVSQMRSIASTDQLDTTLQSVLLGQNLGTASSLIGRTINGLDTDGNRVTGSVDRISVEDNVPRLHIGESTVTLNNIAEILKDGATSTTDDTTATEEQ